MTWACPTCGARHNEPPIWVVPEAFVGDHRSIFYCCQCDSQICIRCYVEHTEKHHPKRPTSWLGQDRKRRKF
jgi:hypothetical protein